MRYSFQSVTCGAVAGGVTQADQRLQGMKMTKKNHCHVFTSESVSEGHPDKVADQISDAVLDACLKADKNAHVACETTVGPDVVVNVGEITCKGFDKIDTEMIARRVCKKIGYDQPGEHFDAKDFQYLNYLQTKDVFNSMGITDDKWLVVIAMGMAAMNIILLRNAFEGVPSEIEEAAIVDGASEFQVLRQVYIPMSKSTIATVALFFAISRWNGYFWARQMISNSNEHPLQVFIRLQLEQYTDPEFMAGWNEVFASDSMIYALIVCSIVPILVIYPFIQKYFAKGVNVGGVKE